SHDTAAPNRSPLARKFSSSRLTAPPKTLTGRLVQLVPKGMRPVSQPVLPGVVAQLPATYYVEGAGNADLVDAVRRELSRKDMLGETGREVHRAELEAKLAASAHNATFSRMASEEGFRLEPFEVTGAKQQTVEVNVRARASDVELVTGPMTKGELGEVNRSQ